MVVESRIYGLNAVCGTLYAPRREVEYMKVDAENVSGDLDLNSHKSELANTHLFK